MGHMKRICQSKQKKNTVNEEATQLVAQDYLVPFLELYNEIQGSREVGTDDSKLQGSSQSTDKESEATSQARSLNDIIMYALVQETSEGKDDEVEIPSIELQIAEQEYKFIANTVHPKSLILMDFLLQLGEFQSIGSHKQVFKVMNGSELVLQIYK